MSKGEWRNNYIFPAIENPSNLNRIPILLQEVIKTLKTGKSYEFAADYTNDPYYGKKDQTNEKYVIRGQAKKSTNSFYSYISLYITKKNERFTVSVLPLEQKKTKVEYLSHFIDLIKRLNLKIKVLCLDREFYCTDVFEFLQNNNVPHIVPVIKRGEQMKQILKEIRQGVNNMLCRAPRKRFFWISSLMSSI